MVVAVSLTLDAPLDGHTHAFSPRLVLMLRGAARGCKGRVWQSTAATCSFCDAICFHYLLGQPWSQSEMGVFLRSEQINAVLSLPTKTINHMENKINFSAVLLCFRFSQKVLGWFFCLFFIWGTFVHVSPVTFYWCCAMWQQNSTSCLQDKNFHETNSETVTLIHTAAGKMPTCSVLDVFQDTDLH